MIDEAKRMSGSSVMPAGSKRMLVKASTKARSGTPYCSPYEMDLANASMIPDRVDPCLETVRKISPGRPSPYSPMVAKPLQSATRNSKVRLVRVRGSFWRTGCGMIRSTMRSTISAGVLADGPSCSGAALSPFFWVDSGCPTLQLSR